MTARKSPDAFRTIGEVAAWLGVSSHVLRFWETKFPQIKPVKRAGGRRYYRPQDMALIGGLKQLLHEDGLTIKGAQKVLREKGVKSVAALSPPLLGMEGAPAEEAAHVDAAQAGSAAPDISPETVHTAPSPEPVESEPAESEPGGEALAPAAETAEEAGRDVEASAGSEAATDGGGAEAAPAAAPDRAMPPRAPLPGAPDGQLGLFGDLPPLPGAPDPEPEPASEPTPEPAAAGSAPDAHSDAPPDAPLPAAIVARRHGGLDTRALAALLARAEALRARMAAHPRR
ncbi:MerR family transcriptional regulator [Rhodovulum sp. 12E13]|uniref:MerR family transcriptional regulator n=1 Tax=Rhodovulum sp. 12E13 TaxID=2203891 RepID=UPI000E12E6E2|nr:MerR family transcriptional regulator [Rhodovulum sp. 12E13]RDC71657.1 MerR family transcriptional regulator [Rhodovulum sp. 12E13]